MVVFIYKICYYVIDKVFILGLEMKSLRLLTVAICLCISTGLYNAFSMDEQQSLYDTENSSYSSYDETKNDNNIVEKTVSLKALQYTTDGIPESAVNNYPILAKFLVKNSNPINRMNHINEFKNMKNELLASVETFHKDVNCGKYNEEERFNIRTAFLHILYSLKDKAQNNIQIQNNTKIKNKFKNLYRKLNSEKMNSIAYYIGASYESDNETYRKYRKKYSLEWDEYINDYVIKFA